MMLDATYLARSDLAPARHLHRAGQWDLALAVIAGKGDPAADALRAEILVERHIWRLDKPGEALAAIDRVADPVLGSVLTAQLEYWRRLFQLEGEAVGGDPISAFAAAEESGIAGWATFWHGVSIENLNDDGPGSAARYQRALELARADGNAFLESYVVRHQGDQLINREGNREAGIALLRRSLQLRAAAGARPQVAAAQTALAGELPAGDEADELRDIARRTARDLGIPWLQT